MPRIVAKIPPISYSQRHVAHYRSAIRCACCLDRPDILERLVWSYQAWEQQAMNYEITYL